MSILNKSAYGEYVDFITSQPSPNEILNFRPSLATQKRIRYLMNAKLEGALSPIERDELDEYYRANRFIHELKLRAQRRVEEIY